MNSKLHQYNILGVINVTPNSFSEDNESKNTDYFINKVNDFIRYDQLILDIGFESTAPMNSSITFDEEIERFKSFFILLEKSNFTGDGFLSFDTYKISSFSFFYNQMRKKYPQLKFIFNDVSGVFDREIQDFLLSNDQVYYVYCATRIKSRGLVHQHMKNFEENVDIISEVADQFIKVHQWFKTNNLEERLILDPGFGFSKKIEENWKLIKNFQQLIRKMSDKKIENPIMIGISKKSFLQKVLSKQQQIDNIKEETEYLHFSLILEFLKIAPLAKYIFRVHRPQLVENAKSYTQFRAQLEK